MQDIETLPPDLLAKLPEVAFVDNSHDKSEDAPPVIAIKRGQRGYYPVFTRLTADELNEQNGVTPSQRDAMYVGSLFGWNVPGANPDFHVRPQTGEAFNA